jgi:acetolactate synthase-1/2/3 large subunit
VAIECAEGIAEGINEAFAAAGAGEPGPVVAEVPHRLFRERMTGSASVDPAPAGRKDPGAMNPEDAATIQRIADIIRRAGRIGIYAGKGAAGAEKQIRELAESLCAPVATTISGKGALPEDHELSVGFGFGPTGSKVAREVFGKCEVVLALGCKFGEMSTGKWMMEIAGTLVHVDTSAEVLNRNYPAAEALCMDARVALRAIVDELKDARRGRNEALLGRIAEAREVERERARAATAAGGIHPSRLLRELRDFVAAESVVVTDCGSHQLWAIQDYPVLTPGGFITPSDYQAMGFGLPAAIGACIARPGERVICLTGDGGFLMSGFELLTAVRERLPLAVVVFNDGSLGLIRDMQEKLYGRTDSVDFVAPRYREMAAALGVDYVGIEEPEELREGLQRMANATGPVLVNVRVASGQWPRFIDQMARATWWRLPISEKARTLGRRAGRLLKYGR